MRKKTASRHKPAAAPAPLPLGMQHTRERHKRRSDRPKASKAYTPMETGHPEPETAPDSGAPGGPLSQEGEGERQNDQLAELEQIEPDLDKEK